jgi:hypothetical protein
MASATVTANVLPPDAGSASFYWTVPNFNVGFLP